MWYLVEAEEKFNIPKGLKDIPLYTCTKGRTIRKLMGGVGKVQKKYSHKAKLNEKKFMHAS